MYMYMLQGLRYNISMMVFRVLCVSIISIISLSSSMTVMDFFGNKIKDESNLRFAVLKIISKIM